MAKSIRHLFFALIVLVSFVSFYTGLFLVFFVIKDFQYVKSILFHQGLIVPILSLTPLVFGAAILVSDFFKKRISKSIVSLKNVFNELNSIEDLATINLNKHNLFFKEYNTLIYDLEKFLERIKQLAVDKEELSKIIKMFEKYMITFETLKNPELFMKKFVLETQQILKIDGYFFLWGEKENNINLYLNNNVLHIDEVTKVIKEYLSKNLLKNGFANSFKNGEIKIGEDLYRIYFKKVEDVPFLSKCISGVITKECMDDTNKRFILENLLTFFNSVEATIKILSKNIEEIEYFLIRDSLTNLFNQRAFWDELDFRISIAMEYNKKLAVVIIDLDNFKKINDTYGHYVGDRVLEEVAKILKKHFSGNHFISRYGGDEFVGILFDIDLDGAVKIANFLREDLYNHPFYVNKELILHGITATMGIAIYPDNAQSAKDLFILADNMVLKGKRFYKNSVMIPDQVERLTFFKDDAEISLKIMESLKNKRIKFSFQPIYSLNSNNIFGYEVLTRLEVGEIEIGADKFINIISKLRLSMEFDFLVVEKVFRYLSEKNNEAKIFINITPLTLSNEEFYNFLKKLSETYNIDNEKIVFEIVERESFDELDKLIINCNKIKRMGFKFAIDDFGSGYSSFTYIKTLPADFVKIEGEFVRNIKHNLKDKLIVDAITNICRIHNVSVIAEYVEDETILKEAMSLGIDLGQGFYLGKPEELAV